MTDEAKVSAPDLSGWDPMSLRTVECMHKGNRVKVVFTDYVAPSRSEGASVLDKENGDPWLLFYISMVDPLNVLFVVFENIDGQWVLVKRLNSDYGSDLLEAETSIFMKEKYDLIALSQ